MIPQTNQSSTGHCLAATASENCCCVTALMLCIGLPHLGLCNGPRAQWFRQKYRRTHVDSADISDKHVDDCGCNRNTRNLRIKMYISPRIHESFDKTTEDIANSTCLNQNVETSTIQSWPQISQLKRDKSIDSDASQTETKLMVLENKALIFTASMNIVQPENLCAFIMFAI